MKFITLLEVTSISVHHVYSTVQLITLLVISIPSPSVNTSCFQDTAVATSHAVWYQALFVNCVILAQGCKAVAHAAAQLSIADKFDIVFCLLLRAWVITLFSTGLVDVVDKAVSTTICAHPLGCNIQVEPSYTYQSFICTGWVSTAVEATQCV